MAVDPMKHSLTEAVEGQTPPAAGADAARPGGPPGPATTPDQIAEETRRQQEARDRGRPDRDEFLVNVGRGQQTHG